MKKAPQAKANRRLVLQVSIDSGKRGRTMFSYIPELYEASAERARLYAARTGADYLAIHAPRLQICRAHPAWQRFVMFEPEFDYYNQILYLDSDVLVRSDAPDIFETYPIEGFYAAPVLSSDPSPEKRRLDSIREQCELFGLDIDQYFNTGVILVGVCTRKRIRSLDWPYKIIEYKGLNQPTFNKIVQNYIGLSIIDWRFNFLFKRENQEDFIRQAYFIHFLGKALFDEEKWRNAVDWPRGPANLNFLDS